MLLGEGRNHFDFTSNASHLWETKSTNPTLFLTRWYRVQRQSLCISQRVSRALPFASPLAITPSHRCTNRRRSLRSDPNSERVSDSSIKLASRERITIKGETSIEATRILEYSSDNRSAVKEQRSLHRIVFQQAQQGDERGEYSQQKKIEGEQRLSSDGIDNLEDG